MDASGGMERALSILEDTEKKKAKIYVIGNGGSAAIASHAVTDLVNTASLNAATLHEPALLTCLTNDYGYEEAFRKMVAQSAREEDLLIAVSSSGYFSAIATI